MCECECVCISHVRKRNMDRFACCSYALLLHGYYISILINMFVRFLYTCLLDFYIHVC